MTDVRLPSAGNIIVRWHAANAFANPAKPTPTEVNAGLNITDDISWNDFDFGLSASNTVNDPSLKAKSNTADRGAMQYGGGLSLYLPADFDDATNTHATAYAAMGEQRTTGWVTIQVDGEVSETSTPLYTGGLTQTAADGDFIHVFKVMTAGEDLAITGEEAFRATINLLSQGEAYPYAVVSAAAPTIVVTPAAPTPAPGDIIALKATVNGRPYTRGVRWTTDDPAVATVSQNGIVTIVGGDTDTATITATYLGATDTAEITVTA
jgi:hypothetical protein